MKPSDKAMLRAKLTAKTIEVAAWVAKEHGMGAPSEVSADDYQRLEDLTKKRLDKWAAANADEHFNKLAGKYFAIKKKLDAL